MRSSQCGGNSRAANGGHGHTTDIAGTTDTGNGPPPPLQLVWAYAEPVIHVKLAPGVSKKKKENVKQVILAREETVHQLRERNNYHGASHPKLWEKTENSKYGKGKAEDRVLCGEGRLFRYAISAQLGAQHPLHRNAYQPHPPTLESLRPQAQTLVVYVAILEYKSWTMKTWIEALRYQE